MDNIQYDVNKDGSIVNVRKGDDIEGFVLAVSRGEPLWRHKGKSGKWNELDKAVIAQPLNEWFIYSGFPNPKEVKRAGSHLRNIFSWKKHGGFILRIAQSPKELSIAVLKLPGSILDQSR